MQPHLVAPGTATEDTTSDLGSLDSFHAVAPEDSLTYQELKRHNLWQKSLELSRLVEEDDLEPGSAPAPSSGCMLFILNES